MKFSRMSFRTQNNNVLEFHLNIPSISRIQCWNLIGNFLFHLAVVKSPVFNTRSYSGTRKTGEKEDEIWALLFLQLSINNLLSINCTIVVYHVYCNILNGVRYFSKAFSKVTTSKGYFPKRQLFKSVLTADLGLLAHSSRSDRPPIAPFFSFHNFMNLMLYTLILHIELNPPNIFIFWCCKPLIFQTYYYYFI